jgi:hypothetical protein
MASKFDESDFVDTDYQNAKSGYATTATHSSVPVAISALNRLPSREELETKVAEAQNRLEELRRAQEQLQRERASLEEAAVAGWNIRPVALRCSSTSRAELACWKKLNSMRDAT